MMMGADNYRLGSEREELFQKDLFVLRQCAALRTFVGRVPVVLPL